LSAINWLKKHYVQGRQNVAIFRKIIELLCVDHPDLSSWTIICANERAIDPVQYLIHSELGGILPKVEGFNSYITRKNGEN